MATDCGIFAETVVSGVLKSLRPEDRLEILRAADTHRKWSSLDDRRFCTICNKFVTGRQIEIRRDQRGRFLLHCPTKDCSSTAQDWFYCGKASDLEAATASGRRERTVFGSVNAA